MADTAIEHLPAGNLSDRPLQSTDTDHQVEIQQGNANIQLELTAVDHVADIQQQNSNPHLHQMNADHDQEGNTVKLLEPTGADHSDDIPERSRDRSVVLSQDITQGDETQTVKLAPTNSEILDKMSMKIEFSMKTRSAYSLHGDELDEEEAKSADGDEHFDPVFEKIKESLSKMDGARSRTASVSSDASNAENPFGKISEHYTNVPYGIQPIDTYEHGKNETDIMGVSYNGRMRQFIFLDSKGIVSWKRDRVDNRVTRSLMYPRYEYRLITYLVYARKHNCYFALSKDFSLKVLNRDFVETCSISADLTSVLFMLFNPLRDELITGGVNGIQVYLFHQTTSSLITEVKPLANYQLTFRYSLPNVGGTWVKKVELDYNLEHLYCCSDTDLHVYNLEGKQLFQFHRAHSMSITGCRYSVAAKLLVTCSLDTEVKVWSMTGGLVHTFRGHSRPVTNLLIHPHNSTIVITCSLDGSVRMWSLDTMDEIYNLTVSTHGLLWMGLTDDNVLYVSTARSLSMWNLNHFVHFWSLTRNQVTCLQLEGCIGKTQRVVAVGEDSSVRLFARSNQKNLSTVLPPPNVSPLQKILGVCYSREFNVIFVLINPTLIWVYTTRTDPACRIAVWNVRQIQTMSPRAEQTAQDRTNQLSMKPSPIHRATQNGAGNELPCNCQCVCILKSSAMLWTDEGCCCPVRHSYLLLGMEDGRVLFMDPVVKGQKYMEFKVSKDPVVGLHHDVDHQSLITVTKVKHLTLIQFWSLPDLELQHEVFCPLDLAGFARIGYSCMTGHESGFMLYHTLELANDPGFIKGRIMPELEGVVELNHHPEHMAPVITVDACVSMKIFCSCSNDGAIKVWEENGALLTEIMLDETLSALCFLNKSADLIIAYQKHIFFISHTKVCPHSQPLECEDLSFDKESYVYEDPAVAYEGFVEDPDPIDLENYLVPFEIEFSKDFLEGKVTLEPAKEVPEESEEEDRLSFAPTEIYESRPSTPGSLSYVDLTLRSEVTKHDLMQQMKSTLEVLIEKQKRKSGRKIGVTSKDAPVFTPEDGEDSQTQEGAEGKRPPPFEFPRFDGSPGPTPTMTPTSSPELVSEESEAEEEETDIEDELRDRLPPKKFPDMQLIAGSNQTKADKEVSDQEETKDLSLPTPKRTRKAIADVEIDVASLMKEKRSVMGTSGTSAMKKDADHSHVAGRSGGETVQREKPQRAPVKKKSVWQHKRAPPKERRQPSPPRETVTGVSLQNDKEDAAAKQTSASDDSALCKDSDDTRNHETDVASEDVSNVKKKSTTEHPFSSKSVESAKSADLPRDDSVTEMGTSDTKIHGRQETEASASPSDSAAATVKDTVPADGKDTPAADRDLTAASKDGSAAASRSTSVTSREAAVSFARPGTAASTSDARYIAGAQSPYPGSVGEEVNQAKSQGSWVSSREENGQFPGPQEDFLPNIKDSMDYSNQPPSHIVPSTPTRLSRTWSHGSDSMFEEQDLDKGQDGYSSPRPPRSTPNIPQSPRQRLPSASTPRSIASPRPGEDSVLSERGGASPDSAYPETELAILSHGEDGGDAFIGEDEDEHRAWSRIGLPDPTIMGEARRPTTTNIVPSKHTLQLEGLIKRRPFTAAQSRFHTDELRSVFEAALDRYQKNHGDLPGEGEKLYMNRGINFEDKWQERVLERHMLLRMQRLLRVCAAQQRRQAIMQQRTKSAPLHKTGQQSQSGRLLRSSTGHTSTLTGQAFSPAPPTTTPAVSRPTSAMMGGQVPSLGQQQVMQKEKRQQLLAQKEKQELGEEQPFRLRLREPADKSPRTPRQRVKIDPWLIDPRNPSAVRPRSSKSIPSKCSRYVLLSRPRVVPELPTPTALEEELLASRFPDQSVRLLHSARTAPSPVGYGVSYTPFSMYG